VKYCFRTSFILISSLLRAYSLLNLLYFFPSAMRYQILDPIDATTNLAALFNSYQRKLFPLEQVVLPRETMSEYQQLLAQSASDTLNEEQSHRLNYCMSQLYYLAVLNNSLRDLHSNVIWAIEALTDFFTRYKGDLQRYAIEERLKIVDEWGSEEESDWEPDGFDEKGEKWKVAYKDDEASLAPYTLRSKLEQFFIGADFVGEKIGTSQAKDFAYFSGQVEHATDFNPIKLLREFTGAELPAYQQSEAGEMIPQSLGEEVESELNEDLRNQSIVAYFRQVLQHCNQAATTWASATRPEHYQALLSQLEIIRDVAFSAPAAY